MYAHYFTFYISFPLKEIENERNTLFSNQLYTLLAIHLGYAIERLKFDERKEENSYIIESNLTNSMYRDLGIKFNDE